MDTSKTHRAFEAWKNLFKAKCLGEDEKLNKSKDYTIQGDDIENPKMKQIKGVVFMSKVLPQPMIRKYTSNVKDSQGNVVHKSGDWIVGRNGKIKLYTTVSICCRMQRTTGEDGETAYDWAPGEDPDTVMGQQIASFLYPLEEADYWNTPPITATYWLAFSLSPNIVANLVIANDAFIKEISSNELVIFDD